MVIRNRENMGIKVELGAGIPMATRRLPVSRD